MKMSERKRDSASVEVDEIFYELVRRLDRRRFTVVRLDENFLNAVAAQMRALAERMVETKDANSTSSEKP